MAKTYRTNPHSEEPPRRRSNRTAGKSSPASFDLPARKAAAVRKTTGARKDTAAHKDTAASSLGNSDKFIGERKGPPEAILPVPEAIAAVPRLPALWEWTPPSGVDGERTKGPPDEAIVRSPCLQWLLMISPQIEMSPLPPVVLPAGSTLGRSTKTVFYWRRVKKLIMQG